MSHWSQPNRAISARDIGRNGARRAAPGTGLASANRGIAAFILAGYCVITGIVYHAFWTYPRFWSAQSEGYPHIWDFFKNFGLVGGLIYVMYDSGFIRALGSKIEQVSALVS